VKSHPRTDGTASDRPTRARSESAERERLRRVGPRYGLKVSWRSPTWIACSLAACALLPSVFGWSWVSTTGALAIMAVAALALRVSRATVLAALLAVGVGALAALEADNRVTFHTWKLWGPPPEIAWRGRDYAPYSSTEKTRSLRRLVALGVTPSATTYYGPPGCSRRSLCMTLYISETPGQFIAYGLLGGP
jgi:hypothetical protein